MFGVLFVSCFFFFLGTLYSSSNLVAISPFLCSLSSIIPRCGEGREETFPSALGTRLAPVIHVVKCELNGGK